MAQCSYREEFPDFDYDVPQINGFADFSWKNDACPHFANADDTLHLWCDYANPALREVEGGKRFTLVAGEYGTDTEVLCETDDVEEIIAACESALAAKQIRDDGRGFGNRA